MAKLSVTVVAAVILFLFSSTLSKARVPSDVPENDFVSSEIRNSRQESDVHAAIRSPSETSSYKSHAHDSGNEGSKPTTTPAAPTVTAVPLKAVKFRPINRHFRLRSSLPFRLCHHHHHHHHHQHHFRPMGQRDEIPYGNDMILSTGENNDLDPMFLTGSLREVQPSWVRIHHHHHHHHHGDVDDDSDAENKLSRSRVEKFDKFGKEKNFRKHSHRDEDEEEREKAVKDDEKMKREEEGGFLKHFRKFLNQFEF